MRRALFTWLPLPVAIMAIPFTLVLALLLAVLVVAICLLSIPVLYLLYWRASRRIKKRMKKVSDDAIEVEYWVDR